MSERGFYPIPIIVESLKKHSANLRDLGEGEEAVVIFCGEQIKVFRNECPHMGAPLNEGILNRKENTLACSWHGYIYDLESGNIKCNPNDAGLIKVNRALKTYKPENTPKYRLRALSFEVREGAILVRKDGSH